MPDQEANAGQPPQSGQPPPQVLSGLHVFDTTGDITSLHQRWERWKDQFLIYFVASGVTNEPQKRALLLHIAGLDVQDIVRILPDAGDTCDSVIASLCAYFKVKKNVTKERQGFLTPKPEENITSFTARLKSVGLVIVKMIM